jgi:rod shape-determining protein MreD
MDITIKSLTRQGLTFCLLFLFLMVSLLPLWATLGVSPNFLSSLIYLWTVYRPDLSSRRLYIILGLVRDGLFGYPLGVSVFEILLIVSITNFLRRYIVGRSYWVVFLGYSLFSILSYSLIWCILSWVKGTLLTYEVVLRSVLLNLFAYPFMCQISVTIQKKIDSLN